MADHDKSHDEGVASPYGHIEPHGDAEDHGHGHGGSGKYIAVFFALCILTMFSFLTYFPFWYESIPLPVSRAFMMAVSCTKALLVMAFFMHLIWEANWKYVLTIPAGLMSIFLMLMLVPDIGCRYPKYTLERLTHAADPDTAEASHGDHGDTTVPDAAGEDHEHTESAAGHGHGH
jgi:cytochrome c oxidase subunit 4